MNNIENRENKIYDFDRNIFKFINDERKSYWLGFLYADGCVYKSINNKTNHVFIKLSINDINHLELFKSCFNLPHTIKIGNSKSFDKVFKTAQIRITSKDMVNDLIKIGCFPNKTYTLLFPDIDDNLVNHFMRGYFDGDGTIYDGKQKNWSILGNYDFLKSYQKILIDRIGVNSVKIHKKGNIYLLSYGGNNNIKKIYDFLYNNSTLYLDRKKEKFK